MGDAGTHYRLFYFLACVTRHMRGTKGRSESREGAGGHSLVKHGIDVCTLMAFACESHALTAAEMRQRHTQLRGITKQSNG